MLYQIQILSGKTDANSEVENDIVSYIRTAEISLPDVITINFTK